jgi:predicted dehydrogenase
MQRDLTRTREASSPSRSSGSSRPHRARPTRRGFLLGSAGAALGAVAPAIFPRGFLGAASPSERIATGHIGVGGMGTSQLRSQFLKNCAAICDVDETHARRAAGHVGRYVPLYRDFRELLDQRDIDGVVIASPDHWHGVMTVLACEAGKDVYVQKPLSLTVEEGRKMVEASRRCGRVIQVGSQGRSTGAAYQACAYIQNGNLGRVKEVTCWHYPNPVHENPKPDSDPPAHLDWDLWLGPVRYVPYNEDRCHFNFRWFLEFGGGQIRDRGAHVMSVALWCMGSDEKGPSSIEATGTAPKRGLWDCPVEMDVRYEFKDPDWTMHWRQPGVPHLGAGFGAVYTGEKDSLIVTGGDGGCGTEEKAMKYQPPADGYHPYKSPGHEQDWLDCMRTRKRPIMHVEAGHAVAKLCILGNISYILGRKLQWDDASERVIGDEEANRMLARPNRSPWHI